uniref:CASP-like protein n=1 Tax=Oryza sativa TaxID=4530 RepID=Q259U2_ORYSA|nr:H0913C04.2 [Oryza sativa]
MARPRPPPPPSLLLLLLRPPRLPRWRHARFFLVANAIVAGYLVLSLPFSAVLVIRPQTIGLRLLLLVCDMIMAAMLTAAASAAAAIVDLAHNGNLRANWVAICMQFHGFCQRTSGSVVASFLTVVILMFLVILAACSIRKR